MFGRSGAAEPAALAAILMCGTDTARAESPFRINVVDAPAVPTTGIRGEATTLTLQLTPETNDKDTVEVWYRGGWGGYRGGWGGYRGYYGGYRGWGWGGYRGGWGGYRPYFSYGYGYARPWVGYYYSAPSYYSYPSYYYYPATTYYYAPCGGTLGSAIETMPPAPAVKRVEPLDPYAQRAPLNSAPPAGTYPYNGGPDNPVPLPKAPPGYEKSAPPAAPTVPMEGRTVSITAKPKYTYPAYGESPVPGSFGQDRTTTVVNKK